MYYVFCIFECLRAPRKMGRCSLGLPSLNKDFFIIIIIIITMCLHDACMKFTMCLPLNDAFYIYHLLFVYMTPSIMSFTGAFYVCHLLCVYIIYVMPSILVIISFYYVFHNVSTST